MKKRIQSKRIYRVAAIICCLMLMISLKTPNTMAWLSDGAEPVINSFYQSRVGCEVIQSFDPLTNQVRAAQIQNTGDIPVYVRIRLIVYRQNGRGEVIGGREQLPGFSPGEYWVRHSDGYYYFTRPLAPGEKSSQLITEMNLPVYPKNESQALEILAEAIQSFPANAASDTWGVVIMENDVTRSQP